MPNSLSTIKRNGEISRSKEIQYKLARTAASLEKFTERVWMDLTTDEQVHLETVKSLLNMMAKQREGTF